MRERIAEVGCGHKEVDEEQFAITPVGSDLRVAVRPFPSWRPGNPCWSLVGSGKMLSLSVMKEGEIAMWLCWRTLTQVPSMDAGYSPGTKIFNSSPKAY